MRYLPLIWSGIWRRRGRSVLMGFQIISAFALFGVLQGVNSGIKQAIAGTHGDRLYITSSVSVSDPLPIGLLDRIRATPGVRDASPRAFFFGMYKKPSQGMPVLAVDAEPFFRIYAELGVSPKDAIDTLKRTRTGAIVGSLLAERYGWKIGDRFVLQSSVAKQDGSSNWEFDVVGVYTSPGSTGTPPPTAVIINFDYLNQARALDADRVAGFVATAREINDAGAVSLAIDNAFANSEHETHTKSEGDLVTTQLQQTVDLDFIVRAIIGTVFFALLLSVGALMMESLRERTPELAVLKTIGFSGFRILILVLAESIMFCICSSALGLAVGALLLPRARALVGVAHMPVIVIAAGLSFALALALIAGAVPAIRGCRLQVVDALAGR